MTESDKALLDFIDQFIEANGYAPSYTEMMDGTGVTTKGTIYNQIERLVLDGRIARAPGISRSIRILRASAMVDSEN